MVFSGREIAKLVVFILLVSLVVFYVASNRQHLFGDLSSGSRSAEGPADVARQADGVSDLVGADVVPVAALETGTVPEPTGPPDSSGSDLFVEFRLQREQARGEQLDLLREVLDNANLSQGARDQALAQWLEITESVAREVDIENLVRAKGFGDAVVVLAGGKATIMVKAASLTPEEVVRVADIAVRVAGLDYEDVTVLPKGG